jgi:alkyl sulfatase BDS1-like metallo-beta-lactamase superfamily hydrolase
MRRLVPLLATLAVGLGPMGCGSPSSAPPSPAETTDFASQAEQFPRGVVEVVPGVHVAIGYGLANSVMIVGDDGVVIVDAMESAEAAAPVREAFRRIRDAPVRAMILTHHHADHVFGAATLAAGDRPEVLAHSAFRAEFDRIVEVTRPIAYRRAMRQFGTLLSEGERVHCGVGPALRSDASSTPAPLVPTRTFDGESLELVVAGIRLVLLHLPGETPDAIGVWLPERRVLLAGDNYYHSFPNLYAIRGTTNRDVMTWVASLDRMRALGAEVLVPGHTLPVRGEAEVRARLTDYRDAIQFVHDQTVRAMNEGREPDEIVATVRLPKELAARPWLAERYGRVDWSVRGIFDGYLGWFGGDAADLSPLSRRALAERIAKLAGGSDKLRDAAREASKRGDARWTLELCRHLASLGEFTAEAEAMRAAALRQLAAAETSANGRNYYLTQALEAEEKAVVGAPDPSRIPLDLLASLPVSSFLRAMTVRLDPAKAEGKRLSVGLRFPDLGEEWSMNLRHGIIELQRGLPRAADMTVTTDSLVWKEVLTRRRNATAAFAGGALGVDRNRLELVRFLFLFR